MRSRWRFDDTKIVIAGAIGLVFLALAGGLTYVADARSAVVVAFIAAFHVLAFLLIAVAIMALGRQIGLRQQVEAQTSRTNAELVESTRERDALAHANHSLIQEVQKKLLAEHLLRESEDRYRQLVELCPDAIFIHKHLRLVFMNSAGARLLGGKEDDLLGQNVLTFVHPDYHDSIRQRVAHMTSNQIGVPFLELRIVRVDGAILDVESSAAPLRDRDHVSIQVVMRDLTERKQITERLREQASLLDQVQDAIIVSDLGDLIQFWNRGAERLYGWKAGEVIGKQTLDILYAEPGPERGQAFAHTREHGFWHGELSQATRNGKRLVVDSRWGLIAGEHGEPRAILAVNTDVTEQKSLEARFLRAQRLESIGTLAGGIAHDLNNVLTPILIAVSLLRKERPLAERNDLLDTAQASILRGSDMVRQLLSFAGGGQAQMTTLNVRGLLDEVIDLLKHTLPKSIAIHLEAGGDLWPVQGDATQLTQVLMNLCVNARDAMGERGTLSIAAENKNLLARTAGVHVDPRVGPHVVIAVSDTGTGMPPAILDKIFDPFFTTKELGKGTGLGLSTALGIVQAHGGTINVYSEPGRGTTFTIYLPAQLQPAVAAAAASEQEAPHGNGECVLVVDDEPFIVRTVSLTLASSGYRCLEAANGEEGLAQFHAHEREIRAVLLDMMMPGLDGLTVLRRLLDLKPDLPIIAASGLRGHGRMNEVLAAGARAFLQKPYSDDQLLRTLAEVLRG